MADNNLFIGKWLPVTDVEVPEEDVQKQVVQFYKDGSCLIPAALLGKELRHLYAQHAGKGLELVERGLMRSVFHPGQDRTVDPGPFRKLGLRDMERLSPGNNGLREKR